MQYDYKPALTPDVCQDGNLLNQSTVFARNSTQQFQFLKTQRDAFLKAKILFIFNF